MTRFPGDYSGLTEQQADLLSFIRADAARRVTPSFDEMRRALGLCSKSAVATLVSALCERGHLRRLPHRARSLVLTDRDSEQLRRFPMSMLIAELERRGYWLERAA